MDADDHKVEVVLKEDRRFMVPLYQRKYQWAEQRLHPFWEDVVAKAAEVLRGENKFSISTATRACLWLRVGLIYPEGQSLGGIFRFMKALTIYAQFSIRL